MNERYVHNIFSSFTDAETKADELVSKGVPKGSISLVAKESVGASSNNKYDFIVAKDVKNDQNWFQKLFGQSDNSEVEGIDFSEYESSLKNDRILLLVDSEFEALVTGTESRQTDHDDAKTESLTQPDLEKGDADRRYRDKSTSESDDSFANSVDGEDDSSFEHNVAGQDDPSFAKNAGENSND